MEKTLSFSVFKEKIIKTNELLNLLLERNKSLEKSQKFSQHLKTRLELTKNEVNKLKLNNETLRFSSVTAEKAYSNLKIEHEVLKQQFSKLENDSNQTINTLQLNYQSVNQELNECQRKLLEAPRETESTKRKKSPRKKKESPVKNNDIILSKTIISLKTDKEKLASENGHLKLQIYELKKKLESFQCGQDNSETSSAKEQQELIASLKDTIEAKHIEIEKLLQEIKGIGKARDALQSDNERLKIENFLCQPETSNSNGNNELIEIREELEECKKKLSAKNKEIAKLSDEVQNLKRELLEKEKKIREEYKNLKTRHVQDANEFAVLEDVDEGKLVQNMKTVVPLCQNKTTPTPTDEEICAIMNGMIVPGRISAMSIEAEADVHDLPTPQLEKDLNNIDVKSVVNRKRNRLSPLPELHFQKDSHNIDVTTRRNNSSPLPKEKDLDNIDSKTLINKRRKLKQRRNLLAKRKFQGIDLFGTLVALKRANIGFIIGNSSFVPFVGEPSNLMQLQQISKPKNIERMRSKTITKELTCDICCKNNFMVLRKVGEEKDSQLLGFLDIKDEKYGQYPGKKTNNVLVGNHFSAVHELRENVVEDEPSRIRLYGRNTKDNFSGRESKRKINKLNLSANKTYNNVVIKKPRVCKQRKQINESVSSNVEIHQIGENVDIGFVNEDESIRKEDESTMKENENSSNTLKISRSCRTSPRKSVINKRKIKTKSILKISSNGKWRDKDSSQFSPKESVDDRVRNFDTSQKPEIVFKQDTTPKSPKTVFKRPVCSTRRSLRIALSKDQHNQNDVFKENDNLIDESPKSPSPEIEMDAIHKPALIPLERKSENVEKNLSETAKHVAETEEHVSETEEDVLATEEHVSKDIPKKRSVATTEKMPNSKIEVLFNKLIVYSKEEEALNEVVQEFSSEDPGYIAEAILERIAADYHDAPDTKYHPAPLMTDVQRTMLGFMSKLEKADITGVFDNFLTLAEQRLLTSNSLQELIPITRLYLAVCKLQKNVTRLRKLCCDVFYFCGDLAVPFFFIVLTSWTEVLPLAADSKDFPIARVLVQIIHTTDCNKPGYNMMALRDLLIKFYGYPSERWDFNEFFKELLEGYLKNPSRSSDFALLLYCKSRPEKWVYEKIDEHLKPLISMNIQDNFKATLIILIGNLYNRFSSKSEVNFLPEIREWMSSLITDGTPDIVRRCIYVCLNRLKKK